ncbi:MAG: PhnD/SsuA/transferrin family substrate-binding protein, partial [Proteobacteria bacterium]|nr:PhnD/SsuA/transferrin family substrate-binding protein [Pseudomonadota bacterium]
IPLVARSDSLSAVIVVRRESPLRTVSDLTEKTVALPPAVAAVSYLTKLTLLEAGLNLEEEIEFKHMKGHDSALHLLLIGDVDACGVAPGPLQVFEAKMATRFRVLAESERISSPLFVAHSRVPENTRDLIKKKLLEIPFSAAANALLGSGEKPFLPVVDSDYDVIRSINKKISVKQ